MHKMKKTNATLLLFLIFTFCFTNFGQRPRPRAAAPPPEKAEDISVSDPESDFAEKGLPPPFIIGLNPSEKLAQTLARDISKYDEKSFPLLIATLQKAGFHIIDRNEKILYSPVSGDGVGMAFYDFEVAGMLKASKLGIVTTLGKLTDIISADTKDVPSAAMGEAILRDLKSALKSENPQVRFVASLIFELGRNFPKPVDLKTASPQNATINIIQASLIERLILGDLLRSYAAFTEGSAFYRPADLFRFPQYSFSFVNAAFSKTGNGPCPDLADLSKLQKYSKNANKVLKTIAIFRELASKWGVDISDIKPGGIRIPDRLISAEKFKNFAKGVSKANAALAWTKLIVGLARIKVKFDVQDPMPLERVKHTMMPGGKTSIVTGQFTMDIPDADAINCAGKALGLATGLSFSVPNNGPFTDKPVTWEVVATGSRETKYTSTPVYVSSPDDNRPDISKQVTNSAGESKVTLTGKPQKENLVGQPVIPIPKHVDLRVSIAMEDMKLGDDAPKLGSFFVGLVSADPLSILSIIPEVLSKVKFSTFGTRIPVRDWAPCTEDWGGEIIYKRTLSQTIVVKAERRSNGNSKGDGVRTISEIDEAIVTLNPRQPEGINEKSPNFADIIARGHRSDIFEGKRDGDPCCGNTGGTFDTVFRSGFEESYSHLVKQPVPISFHGSENDYSLGFDLHTDIMKSTKREFYEIVSSSCPLEYNSAESKEFESMALISASLEAGRYPDRFVNSMGDLLKGEKSFKRPLEGGVEITTWKWELARCKF